MAQTVRTDDGIAIEYKTYGSGPLTALFLHGWGNAASFWDDLFTTRLNLANLCCVAASYRGHGGSDHPTFGYTHDRFSRDMFAVADAVGAERFIMVGFSMAGKFGRYMAYQHPQRVLGQVLIAPPSPGILQLSREAFVPWLDAAPDPNRFREILIPFTKRPVQEHLLALYCQNVSLASRAGLEGTIDMTYESIEDEVSDLRTSTLIIGGAADPLFNPEYIMKRVLPTTREARAVFLPCGHEIPIEMPNETAWLLEAYFAGVQPSSAEALPIQTHWR
jgi:pimeloyl-ACP methyl ester carboxylesterase